MWCDPGMETFSGDQPVHKLYPFKLLIRTHLTISLWGEKLFKTESYHAAGDGGAENVWLFPYMPVFCEKIMILYGV